MEELKMIINTVNTKRKIIIKIMEAMTMKKEKIYIEIRGINNE